jgi:hypothetical protein
MTKQTETKATVTHLLATNDEFVKRAILAMFYRQTADEQATGSTNTQNGVGLNGVDAPFITSLAEQVLGIGEYEYKGRVYTRKGPRDLSENQINAARKLLKKYSGQLVELVSGSETITETETAPTPELDFSDTLAVAERVLSMLRTEYKAVKTTIDAMTIDIAYVTDIKVRATLQAALDLQTQRLNALAKGGRIQRERVDELKAEQAGGNTPANDHDVEMAIIDAERDDDMNGRTAPAKDHTPTPEPPASERVYTRTEAPAPHDFHTCPDCQTLTGDALFDHLFGGDPAPTEAHSKLTMMDVLNAGPAICRGRGTRKPATVATAH